MLITFPKLCKVVRYGRNTISHLQQSEKSIDITSQNHFLVSDSIKELRPPILFKNITPNEIIASWQNAFTYREEDEKSKTKGLRPPQIAAIYASLAHLKMYDKEGTVVMPTGTGKTETMLSILVALPCKKLLIVVPSDSLREQISKKFTSLGLLKNIDFGILSNNAMYPIVGTIKEGFDSPQTLSLFIDNCNVVITTMSMINNSDEETQTIYANAFSHIFIDEAHHVKAKTWDEFKKKCSDAKILQFTATPFRNDEQKITEKIIFSYPLKKAQEEGYFKSINFEPVIEYDLNKADELIAAKAISKLKEDIAKGYNHILMARCNTQKKADEVFKIYEQYPEFNPVVIHTGLSTKKIEDAKKSILSLNSKIIVCVDMLGEGFDLPNLKIAAFHIIKKSLPITLQVIGRFTRTKYDENLGSATVIANLGEPNISQEIEDFYSLGADWNSILPRTSDMQINKQVDFNLFLSGFENLNESEIPFDTLRPAFSFVAYQNKTQSWSPNKYKLGIPNIDSYDYFYHDINRDNKVIIVITGKKNNLKWGVSSVIYNIDWSLYVIYWDTINNILFINCSENSGTYKELAQAIIGKDAQIINRLDTFKVFYNIQRIRLKNVGLKQFLGRNRSYIQSTGYNIEEALSMAEKKQGEKAFVAGVGYENGEKISIGCSYKGRVWSHKAGNIKQFIDWCSLIGKKLSNKSIDPNIILKDTLLSKLITSRPLILPFTIDWNTALYNEHEAYYQFIINGNTNAPIPFYNTELQLENPSDTGDLQFCLCIENGKSYPFTQTQKIDSNNLGDYEITSNSQVDIQVQYGNFKIDIGKFFDEYPPTFWFIDGSALTGSEFIQYKQNIPQYPAGNIIQFNWDGVDISRESQGVDPKDESSIQYHLIQKLKTQSYKIIYDDDGPGEMADIVTISQYDEYIELELYHLKYAMNGKVNKRIDNLYEVCGQAQKSINWKFREPKEIFTHLLRRIEKKKNRKISSRLEQGSIEDLELLKTIVSKKLPVKFRIFIVQPSITSTNISLEQLSLISVAANYIKEKSQIDVTIIGS